MMLAGMVDTLMLSSEGDYAVGAVGTANTYISLFIIMFSMSFFFWPISRINIYSNYKPLMQKRYREYRFRRVALSYSADWCVWGGLFQFLGKAEGEFDAGDEAGEFVFTAEGTDGVENGVHFL
jgi:hypothetical protein